MRHFISIGLIMVMFSSFILHGETHKNIVLNYKASDFVFYTNEIGELEIDSHKLDVSFGSDTTKPALPEIILSVLIPSDMEYVSSSVTHADSVIFKNTTVARNSEVDATNSLVPGTSTGGASVYDNLFYPANIVEYAGTEIMDGHKIVNFLVTPFKYNSLFKNLSLLSSINIDIKLDSSSYVPECYGVMGETVKSLVYNANEYESIMADVIGQQDTIYGIIDKPLMVTGTNNPSYDYVIITNKQLENAFSELAKWKHIKGLRTKIITMEEIRNDDRYTATEDADKLKQCLHYIYQTHRVKFFLLGGDYNIVPVKYCYCKPKLRNGIDPSECLIPTDLYYACFDGDFWWNSNKNDKVGEKKDGMDLSPDIYLTRLPLSSASDVNDYVQKLINYEKYTNYPSWSNNILMVGNLEHSSKKINGRIQSDAEYKGNRMYNEFISKNWVGGQFRLYDTYSDHVKGSNYNFYYENFQEELSKGYPFVNVLTHGSENTWRLEKVVTEGDNHYFDSYARDLKNSGYSVITTDACNTNAFDKSNSCLSEAFIRNKNSGIVAYHGSSRIGIGNSKFEKMGVSQNYISAFYKVLITSKERSNMLQFGKLTTKAKSSRLAKCDKDDNERFIQYALNPIGDCEMVIYTIEPKEFKDLKIDWQRASLTIDTGVPDCSIVITEDGSDNIRTISSRSGETKFHIVNSNKKLTFYISHNGYKPYIFEDDHTLHIFQGEIVGGGDIIVDHGEIIAGDNVTDSKPKGIVTFDGGNIELKASSITFEGGVEIKKNTNFKISPK